MTRLRLGDRVDDKYIVRGVLGAGGCAVVYEAMHVVMRREVAIKVLRSDDEHSSVAVERFAREARLSASIRHPNVLEVFDVGHLDDGSPYLVMELLRGHDLDHYLAGGHFEIGDVLEIGEQLMSALAALASRGIVHRDIKPHNVFLHEREDGSRIVKLLDFGIARRDEPNSASYVSRLTAEGEVVGTPHYMAPEQLRGAKLDARTDVYAASVVLYELITGKVPFDEPTQCALIASVLRDRVPAIHARRPDCPEELVRVVMRGLDKDIDRRWSSPEALGAELARLRDTLGVDAPRTRVRPSDAPHATARPSDAPPVRTPSGTAREPSAEDLVHRPGSSVRVCAGLRRRSRPSRSSNVRQHVLRHVSTDLDAASSPVPGSNLRADVLAREDLPTLTDLEVELGAGDRRRRAKRALVAIVTAMIVVAGSWAVTHAVARRAEGEEVESDARARARENAEPAGAAADAATEARSSAGSSTSTSTSTSAWASAPVAPSSSRDESPEPTTHPAAAPGRARRAAARDASPPAPTPASSAGTAPATAPLERAALKAFARGQLPRARALYRRAIEVSPDDPTAWRRLGMVALARGDRVEARAALGRYLALAPNAPDAGRVRARIADH